MVNKRFDHVGIVVKDVEKQKNFYCDVLGLKVSGERDSIAPPSSDHTNIPGAKRRLIFLCDQNGEIVLELVYYIEPQSPPGKPLNPNQLNAIHLCFNVDNLQDRYKELSNKGVCFLTEPKILKTPDGKTVCLSYAQDPEGNWIELKEALNG